MECVYSVASAEYEKLKKILEENPYAAVSFARVGYTVKDSKGMGLPEGNYVLYFKTEEEVGKQLVQRMAEKAEDKFKKITEGKTLTEEQKTQILAGLKAKELTTLKELAGSDKDAVINAIKKEEENAAQGFGNIFG